MKAKEYFKLEAIRTVVSVVVLFLIASILIQRGTDLEILWNVVILVAISNLITVVLTYLFYDKR